MTVALALLSVAGAFAAVYLVIDQLITLMQSGARPGVVLLAGIAFGSLCAAGVIFISPIVARGIF